MSGIYGIVRFDQKPADLEFLSMRHALQHWGPNGHSSWSDGSVVLGQALLRSTPEASFEQMPALACGNTVCLTVAARLDNRDELCDTFGIDSSDRARISDGRLILLAFEHWGQACVQRLLGDWSFAVWNQQTQSLFLARDHYGNTGLHYSLTNNLFAFSSGIEGLIALEGVGSQANEQKIAELLILWACDGVGTFYKDVFRLPPAHTLTLQNGVVKTERYWKLEDTKSFRLRSDGEYVEAFQAILRTAVRSRLRSNRPVASTLSAGLDSGAVTALAAEALLERGETLTAFTSVPIHAPDRPSPFGLDDEWGLANQTANWVKNITHLPLDAATWTPLAGIRKSMGILREPEFAAANSYWIQALLTELQTRGYGVLLTGQCGNFAASWSGGTYRTWTALGAGAFGHAMEQFISGAKQRQSYTRALLAEILKPAWLTADAGLKRLRRSNQPPWDKSSAISESLVERIGLLEQTKTAKWFGLEIFLMNARRQQVEGLLPAITPIGAIWHSTGAGYGIEVRDPTMDKRLLEFCVGAPQSQFSRGGHDRFLMRRAMQNLLPESVQWNTKRGVQGSDLARRLLASELEVQALLTEIKASEETAACINLKMVHNAWARLLFERQNPNKADAFTVLRGLSVGLFLIGLSRKM